MILGLGTSKLICVSPENHKFGDIDEKIMKMRKMIGVMIVLMIIRRIIPTLPVIMVVIMIILVMLIMIMMAQWSRQAKVSMDPGAQERLAKTLL